MPHVYLLFGIIRAVEALPLELDRHSREDLAHIGLGALGAHSDWIIGE